MASWPWSCGDATPPSRSGDMSCAETAKVCRRLIPLLDATVDVVSVRMGYRRRGGEGVGKRRNTRVDGSTDEPCTRRMQPLPTPLTKAPSFPHASRTINVYIRPLFNPLQVLRPSLLLESYGRVSCCHSRRMRQVCNAPCRAVCCNRLVSRFDSRSRGHVAPHNILHPSNHINEEVLRGGCSRLRF